jgi:putative transposase
MAERRDWWTAAEIAQARLPGMPGSKRGVQSRIAAEGWDRDRTRCRARAQRGGAAAEYHWTLLPAAAVKALRDRGALPDLAGTPAAEPATPPPDPQELPPDAAWERFKALKPAARRAAEQRLAVLREVQSHIAGGMAATPAKKAAAHSAGVDYATLKRWFARVAGQPPQHWLPYLADTSAGRVRPALRVALDSDLLDILAADYCRLEKPAFTACYRRLQTVARKRGVALPHPNTVERRLRDHLPADVIRMTRQGLSTFNAIPPQIRDRSGLHAMQAVNSDFHRCDVFVRWEDGTVGRPQAVGFQDLYSAKILAWRIDRTPNKVAVMAAFSDMAEGWGLPEQILFDNGREFANKWMTGGAPTRFRFKIRQDEAPGVLAQLGIRTHWATPGHGQAKPIERAFRDLAEDISRGPACAGAYVGNSPNAKPENYGARAIPIADFIAIFDAGVAEHNAREGRRSPVCAGRSFDQVFAESYAVAPVAKVTAAQRRMWLMGQQEATLDRRHGRARLHDNHYWADWMGARAGEKVVLRFDPEDLHAGVYVYDREMTYLGFAPCQQAVGFFDVAAARTHARQKRERERALKALAKATITRTSADVAAELAAASDRKAPDPEAKVVRPAFGKRPEGPLVTRPDRAPARRSPEEEARYAAFVADFEARKRGDAPPADPAPAAAAAEETRADRFARARALEARQAAGEALGAAEADWLRIYQAQPEYRAQMRLLDDFGEAMFGE